MIYHDVSTSHENSSIGTLKKTGITEYKQDVRIGPVEMALS